MQGNISHKIPNRFILEARYLILDPAIWMIEGDFQIVYLREIIDADRDAVRRGVNEASIKLSGEVHPCLGGIAGNPIWSEILDEPVSRSSSIIATCGQAKQSDCSAEEHGQLRNLAAHRCHVGFQGDTVAKLGFVGLCDVHFY